PFQMQTVPAPEPCDVYWKNTAYPVGHRFIRNFIAVCIVGLLYVFWTVPLATLAGFLDTGYLGSKFPMLKDWFDSSQTIKMVFDYTFPILAVAGFNFVVPYLLGGISTYSGIQRLSAIQATTLKRHHLFLLVSVVLIFQIVPGVLPEK